MVGCAEGLGRTAILKRLIIFLAMVSLGACSQDAIMAQYESSKEVQLARDTIERLRARDFDAVLARLSQEDRENADLLKSLPTAADYFPSAEPVSVKLVEYQAFGIMPFGGQALTNYTIGFEYQFPEVWVIAIAMLRTTNADTSFLGIRLFRNPDSLETINTLTFQEKGIVHYVMTILAAGILAFVVATLIACIRTKIPKRKWLWIIFIIVGVGQVTLNWTTGEVSLAPAVNLFGVALSRLGYGPWLLSLAVPLGATVFWWRKRYWVEKSPADQFA